MTIKTYILCDSFDGRTIRLLHRASCRKTARKQAQSFSRQTTDSFDLIECKNDGERLHVQYYTGKLNK